MIAVRKDGGARDGSVALAAATECVWRESELAVRSVAVRCTPEDGEVVHLHLDKLVQLTIFLTGSNIIFLLTAGGAKSTLHWNHPPRPSTRLTSAARRAERRAWRRVAEKTTPARNGTTP